MFLTHFLYKKLQDILRLGVNFTTNFLYTQCFKALIWNTTICKNMPHRAKNNKESCSFEMLIHVSCQMFELRCLNCFYMYALSFFFFFTRELLSQQMLLNSKLLRRYFLLLLLYVILCIDSTKGYELQYKRLTCDFFASYINRILNYAKSLQTLANFDTRNTIT